MESPKSVCSAIVKSEWSTVKVDDGTQMSLFVAKPMETTKAPALMVFQEAFGVNAHIQDLCQRFARHGFFAVAPELFHRTAPKGFEVPYDNFDLSLPHTQAIEQETLKADLKACANFCLTHPQVNSNWLGSIGFCLGGRVSFIANATLPLQAAVSFYGGHIAPNHLGLALKQQGPLLLVWAGLDQHIRLEDRTLIKEALYKAKKNFIDIEFSQADHGFFCDARKSYHPIAAQQAWALTIAFLKSNLP